MNMFVLLFVISAASCALSAELYNSKYDNIDVDKILQNNRVLTNYIRCMLDEGSCTAEGRELKKTLPDALVTGCTKCNENQRSNAEKVINHLKSKRSKDWDRLLKKYDPQGEYQKRYDAEHAKAKKP